MTSKVNILNLANKIIKNQIGLIQGAREIAEFDDFFNKFSSNKVSYEDYEIFMDIEDETHNLPLSETERKNWSSTALEIKDQEIKKIEEKYRPTIMKACKVLIKKLS